VITDDASLKQLRFRSEHPLPRLVPRAFELRSIDADFAEIQAAFDLEPPFERRNRAGTVLGVTHFVLGRIRLSKGAFSCSTPDDQRPLETLDTTGSTAI
jgi:hypothetical protein